MLDKESLQTHCEALLEQRLFLQQMKLTKLHQLKLHDYRVVESLGLMKRFLPFETESFFLKLIFTEATSWPELLNDEENKKIAPDFILYLAELSIYLQVNSKAQIIKAFLHTQSLNETAFSLATRFHHPLESYDINSDDFFGDHGFILSLGMSAQTDKLETLNQLITSFTVDDETKNIARLSRTFLSQQESKVELVERLLHTSQLSKRFLIYLFSGMTEDESRAAISLLTRIDTIDPTLPIIAMCRSGHPGFVPFLTEFLSDLKTRDAVLEGISTTFDEDIHEVFPYELYHPTREVSWKLVEPKELEEQLKGWFFKNEKQHAQLLLAGEIPDEHHLTTIWLTGNTLHREQASLKRALNNPSQPLISPTALWGGTVR